MHRLRKFGVSLQIGEINPGTDIHQNDRQRPHGKREKHALAEILMGAAFLKTPDTVGIVEQGTGVDDGSDKGCDRQKGRDETGSRKRVLPDHVARDERIGHGHDVVDRLHQEARPQNLPVFLNQEIGFRLMHVFLPVNPSCPSRNQRISNTASSPVFSSTSMKFSPTWLSCRLPLAAFILLKVLSRTRIPAEET